MVLANSYLFYRLRVKGRLTSGVYTAIQQHLYADMCCTSDGNTKFENWTWTMLIHANSFLGIFSFDLSASQCACASFQQKNLFTRKIFSTEKAKTENWKKWKTSGNWILRYNADCVASSVSINLNYSIRRQKKSAAVWARKFFVVWRLK